MRSLMFVQIDTLRSMVNDLNQIGGLMSDPFVSK